MAENKSLYTNNAWKYGTGELFSSTNPANGEIIWEGRSSSSAEVNEAVESAKNAFEEWSGLSIDARSLFLDSFKKIITGKQAELAELISKENGKPLWDAKNEIHSMINKVNLSLDAYGQRCAGMIHELSNGRSITRHRPHGVMGVIGPYNFPAHIPHGHIIPALLAGNTVVFKPSELTPLTGEYLANCWLEAKLPQGVFNVIQGGKETGRALVEHNSIQGILFTGSYQTGRKISEYFGKYPEKILALEMGGNNPLIINEIEDLIAAAYLTVQSAYLSAGQRCTCARRLILVRSKSNETFLSKLTDMIRKIKIGAYHEVPEPFMGPVITNAQALKMVEIQKKLKESGGKVLIEMNLLKPNTGFLSPGLMDVSEIEELPDEEYFGPFLQMIWVNNLEDALQVANQTKYGMTAGLFSAKQKDCRFFYNHIRAGVISWNTQTTGASGGAPFGGIKCSGNNRPSGYYAADYCTYPAAAMESSVLKLPVKLTPGITL